MLVNSVADELARQGGQPEDDLLLARDASAFYLKLSEGLLQETPGHLPLAEAVSSGFAQYAFAFVAFEADRLEASNARAAQVLRERAARLYRRSHRHAMAALETKVRTLACCNSSATAADIAPGRKGVAATAAPVTGVTHDSVNRACSPAIAVRVSGGLQPAR